MKRLGEFCCRRWGSSFPFLWMRTCLHFAHLPTSHLFWWVKKTLLVVSTTFCLQRPRAAPALCSDRFTLMSQPIDLGLLVVYFDTLTLFVWQLAGGSWPQLVRAVCVRYTELRVHYSFWKKQKVLRMATILFIFAAAIFLAATYFFGSYVESVSFWLFTPGCVPLLWYPLSYGNSRFLDL